MVYADGNTIGGTAGTHSGPTGDDYSDILFGYDGLTTDFVNREVKNLNPLYPTYFQFSLARTPLLTYFCQGVNLPGIELGMIDQPTRFVSIPHSAGAVEFEDLTVSFIVDETLDNWLEIYNWMRSASNTKDFKEYEDSKEHYVDATLTVLNSSMTPQIRVEYENIIPTSLSALEFDSTVSTPEALIASATFKYTTYEITKLS